MQSLEILKNVFFKTEVSEQNLRALAQICLPKEIQKREILFMERDRGFSFYILQKGSIKLFKTSEDGTETVIKIIKPGEMFGEVILFEKDHYPVSAEGLTISTVLMVPKHQFTCLLESEEFRTEFIQGLMNKMRYLTSQLKYLMNHDVEERLFLFLEDHFGSKEQFKINLSKKDVAAAIQTTPETLSRLLLRLKQEDRLVWKGSVITRK